MKNWNQVNLNLIAKSIGELCYEQILTAKKLSDNRYELSLQSGAVYYFSAWMGIWDHLRVEAATINKEGADSVSAGQFFIDAKSELAMTDIVLGNFLEEMNNSLYADMHLLEKQKETKAREMVLWDGEKIQSYLSGHPKILLSKGRVGWGAPELERFAPESENSFELFWVAVRKDFLICSFDDQVNDLSLLKESLDSFDLEQFHLNLDKKNLKFDDFHFLPVHPWQWSRFIKIQFQSAIHEGKIVELGSFGDEYLPQISIRTLRNSSRPEKLDIKLPLTILNTSAIRGIPSKYINIGTKLSRHILSICKEDSLLNHLNTDVLLEKAGMSVRHPEFSQVELAPYRYNELLGAIWRESASSKLNADETAIMTGCLFYQDPENNSLIGAIIEKSKLSKAEWLKSYFEYVFIPLYHLQLKYGLGLVAHGQNIILKMKKFVPCGVILKDFQGDLRLSSNSILNEREDFKEIAQKLDKLPAHYLIHDLMTGHLVTVLRFVSEVMHESDHFSELDFYKILADVIENYSKDHVVPDELNFLNKSIPRVLVNKVRFKIGYGDSSERPTPMVGSDLISPLYLGKKHGEELNG